MTRAKCGTSSGYVTHRKVKEEACLECKEAKRIGSQLWRNSNIEKDRISKKNWAEANIEKVRLKNRTWNHANSDKRSGYKRKRRALEKGLGHSPYSRNEVLNIYGTNCHICKNPIDLTAPRSSSIQGHKMGLHIDHLIPLSKGGQDNLTNVRPAHAICNMKKGARHGAAA